ncbi:MAG: 2-amino-4-oxopentanoate thiolase subunit OrtA [Actinobacteria bacterium]|nr:2-amino-4-oxopentanoate thiolase subunit OrtA [Actinomycetota bacterium]
MGGRPGDWAQVYQVVLQPGERAPQVPDDTQRVPLELRVKGFLKEEARVGEQATVVTVTGREATGELLAINPPYGHDFGRPVPELLKIGIELRAILRDESQAGREEAEPGD